MKRSDADTIAATSELRRELDTQRALVERLTAELAAREAQWAAEKRSLFEQLRVLIEQRFGPSTEKYRLSQRDLFFDEAETLAESEDADDAEAPSESVPSARRRRRRGGRAPLPPELPRVDVIHDLDAAERVCAADGHALVCIGEVVSEQLDIIPARVQVIRHVRRQYACRACEDGVHTAALPPQPLPRSNASPGLLAYVATAKYQDALPLYRQEQVFHRLGLALPRQTLARWMVQLGALVAPLVAALRRHVHTGALIHMDETTVQVNTEPGRAPSSRSYMWVQRGGPPEAQAVVFDYAPSRSAQVPQRLLGDYRGVLVTDGYEGYSAVVRANGLTHAGCWAHARRKFVEADKAQRRRGKAAWALKQIGALYRIERDIGHAPLAERERRRARDSRPVVDALHTWVEIQLERVPPKTALGRALHYLHAQWPKLTRFLDDARIPLDNNAAENAIRPFVVGRKNWLFSHTPHGADASAALYSLIETAKLNGLEPYAYLLTVFRRLPAAATDTDVIDLLPWNQKPSLTAAEPAA